MNPKRPGPHLRLQFPSLIWKQSWRQGALSSFPSGPKNLLSSEVSFAVLSCFESYPRIIPSFVLVLVTFHAETWKELFLPYCVLFGDMGVASSRSSTSVLPSLNWYSSLPTFLRNLSREAVNQEWNHHQDMNHYCSHFRQDERLMYDAHEVIFRCSGCCSRIPTWSKSTLYF